MEYTKTITDRKLFLQRPPDLVDKPIPVPFDSQYLALGADMTSSISVTKNNQAFVSETIGPLSDPENLEKFKQTTNNMLKKFDIQPEKIICDLHPDYNSTKYAQELSAQTGAELIQVQHHLAHIHSVALENNLSDFIGIASDGLGYGSDGNIWGGEVFDGNKRIASLEGQLQLGGDSATQYPEKMLVSILSNFMNESELAKHVSFSTQDISLLLQQKDKKFNSPISTSTGRILDAASVFLGFCKEREYPGSPAIILEQNSTTPYDLKPKIKKQDRQILLTTPIFEYLVQNYDKDKGRLGATVQQYLAEGFYQLAKSDKPIVFSGGCAYNTIMTTYLLEQNVLINEKVPCGDGGISFGQLALANSRD